jgi:GH35 family endo-1,4-beta-xylanase
MPAFMKGKSWDEVRLKCREYIWRTLSEFRTRIHVWEIVNEAHDWANDLNFSQEQLIEMTRLAAETTHAAHPTAFRIVNSHAIWGEYAARRSMYARPAGRPVWTPLDYFRAIQDARIPFEAIGLQVYNPSRDMLEIERHIERFCALGKRVHITELGVPSSSSLDMAGALRPPSPGVVWASRNVWHGTEWTEENQADWVEYFYTICYSKPEIDAISWWSFSDPAAHPFCGLLRRDLQPKKAYEGLNKLITEWRG